ncbi:Group-specific protein [Fusobacterium necrophorum subsp. funduliforme]
MDKIILYIFFGIFDIVGLIVCEHFKKKRDIFEVLWTVFQIGIVIIFIGNTCVLFDLLLNYF